jgi:acyl carrier protein
MITSNPELSKESTINLIIETLKSICNTDMDINPDTVLNDIPNWDSMAQVRLYFILEQKLGFKFDIEDYEDIVKVANIETVINKHTG